MKSVAIPFVNPSAVIPPVLLRSIGVHLFIFTFLSAVTWYHEYLRKQAPLPQTIQIQFEPLPKTKTLVQPQKTIPALGTPQSSPSSPTLSRFLKKAKLQATSLNTSPNISNNADLQKIKQGLARNANLPTVSSAQAQQELIKTLQSQIAQKGVDWGSLGQSLEGDSSLSQQDLAEIMKAVTKHYHQYRDCFERALLLDSSLGGKAQLALSLSAQARTHQTQITLQPARSGSAADQFKSCLRDVSAKIPFLHAAARKQIQFGLFFKS